MSGMTNNLINVDVKVEMPNKYPCLCKAINIILCWSRYVLILPINSLKYKNNHLNIGCTLRPSKFWFSISVAIQLFFGIYIFTTTFLRLYFEVPSTLDSNEWYLMTMGYLIMELDIFITLSFGIFNAKRIGKLFERISRLNGSAEEMRSICYQIRFVLLVLLTCYFILMFSFVYVAYTRLDEFNSITWLNLIDSPPGVIIRGISSIVSHIQCTLVVTLCLLISSKFQRLAETVKSTLEYATIFSSHEQTKTTRKIKTSTMKWMNSETDINFLNSARLEQISDQHQEALYCLSELNDCFGIQLLATLTALLFVIIYYLYRIITLKSTKNYMTNSQQRFHCIFALLIHLIKLLLYIFMGQKINKQSKEPIREMQRGKLLYLPIDSQQQIQSLIMQWSSIEPCYLSAYNVVNIGPWLISPIIGNIITFLLVAMQFKSTSVISIDENTTVAVNITNYI